MEKIQATTQVEKLLRKGDTKEAIERFLDFLENYEEGTSPLYEQVIQVKARFLRAQRRRSIGIISAKREEELVEEIHSEIRFLLARMNGRVSERKKPFLVKIPNYVYFIAMAVAILTTFLTYNITQKKALKKATAHCPNFHEESEFNILILPLGKANGKSNRTLEERAKDRFQLFIDSMNLDISAQISGLQIEEEKYPQTIDAAVRLAENCQAQLVLWAEEDSVHYKFIYEKSNFDFYQLYPGQGDELIPAAITTSIPTHGVIPKNADPNVLNYLLGTAANQIEAYSSSAQLLRTELTDSTNIDLVLLRALQSADSEMEVNGLERAIKAYDTILKLRPELDFARLNQSLLAAQAEQFELALQNLNDLIEKDKKDYLALYTKGRVFASMEQVTVAQQSLLALDSMLVSDSTEYANNFRTTVVQKTVSDIAKKEFEVQRDFWQTKKELRENPKDESLKNKLLCFYLQLGNDKEAQKLLEDYQPSNLKVLKAMKARSLALAAEGKKESALLWQENIPADYAQAKFVSKEEKEEQVL
ncbi:MAG: hypothetical protein AAF806_07115 [Bacteroidota bacterium]